MGMNSTARIRRIRGLTAEKGLDAIFVSTPENRLYLSGFNGSAGYLLVTTSEAFLATDFRYVEQSRSQAPDYRVVQIGGRIEEWFPRLVGPTRTKRIGIESENMTVAFHRQITEALVKNGLDVELVPVDGMVESMRTVKEPEELRLIQDAVRISDAAISHITGYARAGMTEKHVAWEIERFMRDQGSQSMPFEVLVQSGPNSALPHAQPSDRQINIGEPIVMDIGARIGGYASDLTRTICVGEPSTIFNTVYDIVLSAQLAAIAMIREGMTGEAADNIARTIIREAGYGDKFGHSLGHGVGLAVHEGPRLGPNSPDILKSGMVFSIEPGIYLPEWGGIRIEDLATIDGGKIRLLSGAPKVGRPD
jgi:Xaa-Pro aminopeptidase